MRLDGIIRRLYNCCSPTMIWFLNQCGSLKYTFLGMHISPMLCIMINLWGEYITYVVLKRSPINSNVQKIKLRNSVLRVE